MLSSSSHEFSQESFKIKQDDKFFSRLLSKENSVANPSFRVYYGNVSGSVPFTWEIQPGTPKHKFSDNSLPPLTPPPSYSYNLSENKPTKGSKLLNSLFFKIKLSKNGHVASSSPSNLSSSSWSSSSNSTIPMSTRSRRRRILSFGSDGSMMVDDGNLYGGGSPDSVLCFGKNMKKEKKKKKRSGGLLMAVIMKKALLSIVGRRSG